VRRHCRSGPCSAATDVLDGPYARCEATYRVRLRLNDIRIQLLTFSGCPLAEAARAELQAALAKYDAVEYEEVDILDPATPEELRGWGSPTILVDGSDITGQPKGDDVGCRVYPGEKQVPVSAEILAAIESRDFAGDFDKRRKP
jgi:hypothetical protein